MNRPASYPPGYTTRKRKVASRRLRRAQAELLRLAAGYIANHAEPGTTLTLTSSTGRIMSLSVDGAAR